MKGEGILIIGKVVGTVISTRKNSNLVGNKLLIVEPFEGFEKSVGGKLVAIDNVGAGVGEIVLVALGSAARIGCSMEKAPVDAAIVGIVDDARDISEAK
jgi:ethanolamine utilization protein EutN